MDAKDAKLLGSVYSLLLEHGAVSTERLINESRTGDTVYCEREIQWAFYQLDCKEGGGLWTLPDEKLTVNQRNEIRDANEAEKLKEIEAKVVATIDAVDLLFPKIKP